VVRLMAMGFVAVVALFGLRWLRLRDRGPTWGTDDAPIAERKFDCLGAPGGNRHGNCAENWWQHIWNDWPYCSDEKERCEWGGGKFVLRKK